MRVRPAPQWWVEVSAGYLRSLARRGRRPNTRRAYTFELLDFGDWLQRTGVEAIIDLTREHIEAWQDDVQTRKAPGTQQVTATAVRGALRWAADQELPMSSPTLWLRVAQCRAPRRKPRPIPLRDLKVLWAYLELAPEANGERLSLLALRTRALFWILFSSGARISEALQLDRDQLQGCAATVIQKGGFEHELVISATAAAAMVDYLAARSDAGRALFVSHKPGRETGKRLVRSSEQLSWNHLCRLLGIARFTSHQLRHSCATELVRRHVDSMVVSKHMGHRSLSSLAGYVEIVLDTRREAMAVLDCRMAS